MVEAAAAGSGGAPELLTALVAKAPRRFPKGPPEFRFKQHDGKLWCCTGTLGLVHVVVVHPQVQCE